MKTFSIDWGAELMALPRYLALSPGARKVALREMRPTSGAGPTALGAFGPELVESGFAVPKGTGATLVPAPETRVLHMVLRALDRRRLWEDPTPTALLGYVEEHFTTAEVNRVVNGHDGGYTTDRPSLVNMVAGEEWMEGFLAAETPGDAFAWEHGRLTRDERPRFADPHTWRTARALVQGLLAAPAPVPLSRLGTVVPDAGAYLLGAGLEAALRHFLVFIAVQEPTLEPAVWAWPEVRTRLAAPPPPAPGPVEVAESFEAAWLMEDMTAVLVAASAEPIRLRGSDGALFAASRKAIDSRLITLPEWVMEAGDVVADERAEDAAGLLRACGFAAQSGREGKDLRLTVTKKGAEWLALSARDRLAAVLDRFRASKERNPSAWYGTGETDFFPVRINGSLPDTMDARAALTSAMLALPPEMVSALEFTAYAGHHGNPFEAIMRGTIRSRMSWQGPRPTRRDWERLWGQILAAFLLRRLAPLGGARLGRSADGRLCFALTDAGRYLLGAADAFEYGHEAAGEVIVQPNFDVVFLAPDPRLEARFARLAERVGSGVGIVFRLTRASVLGAVESGMDGDQVVEALRGSISRPLPANVELQVRDWMGAVRRVQLRPAVLIECPDAETAARVLSVAGKQVRALTDTLIELPDATPKDRNALVKKLRTGGVFVN